MEREPKVKICGITSPGDARLAVKLGADMIGFNFFPGSKRFINSKQVESILKRLSSPITKVGVFVNQPLEEIIEAQRTAVLDAIQLHGDEPPGFVDDLRNETDAKIVKVFRVGENFDKAAIDDYDASGIMLDSFSLSAFGGTGKIFDWSVAAGIAKDVDNLYLAGGLNPENVAEAVRAVRPYAVDVASGVESSPGKKDPKKLEAFIRNAKNA